MKRNFYGPDYGLDIALKIDAQGNYATRDITNYIIAEMAMDDSPNIMRITKKTMSNIDTAIKITEETTALFDRAYGKLQATELKIATQVKLVSASVRDAQQKLSDGLDRISKTADFAKMERYVAVLERAAAAMTILAELEKSGHMEKFAKAMK